MKITNYLLPYNQEIFFNNCSILKYIKYYQFTYKNGNKFKFNKEKYGIAISCIIL